MSSGKAHDDIEVGYPVHALHRLKVFRTVLRMDDTKGPMDRIKDCSIAEIRERKAGRMIIAALAAYFEIWYPYAVLEHRPGAEA